MSPKPPITLRPPSTSKSSSSNTTSTNPISPPSTTFLTGTWHVTHSTLPMWRKARNLTITYTPLPSHQSSQNTTSNESSPPKLHDEVKFQSLSPSAPKSGQQEAHKTISGTDTPSPDFSSSWSYTWRGSGWLKLITSKWEVLGYGDETVGELGEGTVAEQWVVTYFAKTMFTPAGVDVYSRRREGLSFETTRRIGEALTKVEDPGIKELVGGIFEVKRD